MTITAGLSLLVYALVDANSAGWGSTQTLGLVALAARADRRVLRDRAAQRALRWSRSRASSGIRTITGINVSAV